MNEEIIDILKKYIKVLGEGDNRCLVFKGVSPFKNKKDFESIIEFIKEKKE